jgi:hypothetical protein
VFAVDDFRISTGWRTHPKRAKLERRLGRDAVLAITDLWGWCAAHPERRAGDLSGMDDEDIALAADYPGEPGEFVRTLVALRLLDGVRGAYRVHDYVENNPHVAGAAVRSEAARASALVRWHIEGKHEQAVDGCPHCESKSTADAASMQSDASHATVSNGTAPTQPTNPTDPERDPARAISFRDIENQPSAQSWPRLGSAVAARLSKIHGERPIAQDEFDEAAAETNSRSAKPNWAYFAAVLEGLRRPRPSRGPPERPPPDTSAFDEALVELGLHAPAAPGGAG